MDSTFSEQAGGFLDSAANAIGAFQSAFERQSIQGADRVAARNAGTMNWKVIALAIGGVLAAAVVLRFAFKR